jgi:hypothetical protein
MPVPRTTRNRSFELQNDCPESKWKTPNETHRAHQARVAPKDFRRQVVRLPEAEISFGRLTDRSSESPWQTRCGVSRRFGQRSQGNQWTRSDPFNSLTVLKVLHFTR